MNKLSVSLTKVESVFGWIYLPFQLLLLPVILTFINMMLGYPLTSAGINFVFFCVNFILVTVFFSRFLWRSAKVVFAKPLLFFRAALIGFAAYWLLSIGVGYLISVLHPEYLNLNDGAISNMAQSSFLLISFGTVILAPVVEEILYRGLLFGTLYNYSRVAAYVISSFVFSAIHIIGYVGFYDPLSLLLSFLQYLPAGLCLGWAYAKSDSIWAPILMHILINLIGISAMR